MGCSSRERKTKHNNPAMDSRFPIQALEFLDKTMTSSTLDNVDFGWKPMSPETHMVVLKPAAVCMDCIGAVARLVSWPVAAFSAPSSRTLIS